MIQPEILERMKDLPRLSCDTKLFCWPVQYRDRFEEYYDEWARITGYWPSAWKWGTVDKFAIDVDRCRRMESKICLHISPYIPEGDDWKAARDLYVDRWGEVAEQLDLSLVEAAYIDLEGFPYTVGETLTDGIVRHNDAVRSYNEVVYRIAKEYLGDDVKVGRYSHGATGHYNPSPAFGTSKVSRHTCWADPVDGGWGVSWYTPVKWPWALEDLEATIQEGRQHGMQEGTVWPVVGCSIVDWLCPGLEDAFPLVTTRVYAVPYDPKISHKMGSLFGHSYWKKEVHGDDWRNDTYPPMSKVHSVCLWPGVFHKNMDSTAIHLVAFLEGMSTKPFDKELRRLQVEAVGDERIRQLHVAI